MVFWTSFNVSLLRLFATLAAEWHQAFSKLASDLPQKWLFLKGFRCCWKNGWKLWWQRSLFQRFLLVFGPWWPSSRWGWFLVRRGSLWWHWSSQICVLVFSLSPPFLVYYRYVHFTFPLVYRWYSSGFLNITWKHWCQWVGHTCGWLCGLTICCVFLTVSSCLSLLLCSRSWSLCSGKR